MLIQILGKAPSLLDDLTNCHRSSLQHQVVLNAKAAISSLDDGSHIFRECLESTEPLPILVQSLLKTGSKYADSRSTRILGRFQKHSLWLQNMAPAIDVVVNVQAGIAAPIWAPIRYVLKASCTTLSCSS